MLKFQIALAIILVGCVAFVACERGMVDPGDMTDPGDDKPMDMTMDMMDMTMYTSSITLDAPTMTVAEAAAAMNPGGTGAAHGMGSRTVYFNEAGAMANKAGTAYPAGTMILKKVMDPTETFVMQVVTMMKVDSTDPMYAAYAAYNDWVYGATQRASETEELMMPQTVPMEVAAQCHDCHMKAGEGRDSVFVSLTVDETTDPPATDPPATDPPATDPPATDPPATDPPATDPPATDPPENNNAQ